MAQEAKGQHAIRTAASIYVFMYVCECVDVWVWMCITAFVVCASNVFCKGHELCYSQQIFMQPNAFHVIAFKDLQLNMGNLEKVSSKGTKHIKY